MKISAAPRMGADAERPVVMTAESVRGCRAGRKTQTRRLADLHALCADVPYPIAPDLPGHPMLKRGRYRIRLNPQGAITAMPGHGLKPGEFHLR